MTKNELLNCFLKSEHARLNKYLSQRPKQNKYSIQSITFGKDKVSVHLRFFKGSFTCELRKMFIITLLSYAIH